MSGPLQRGDLAADDVAEPGPVVTAPEVTVSTATTADVGGTEVHRLLPRRARRTLGAWCFLDHAGPRRLSAATAMQIGPHPHIGLHTVTWLLEGTARHTDSLGSDQLIRPGQLNLMTAGHGIAHAEDGREHAEGTGHGVQLWVAQPEATRHGAPAFEHHTELPALAVARPGAGGADGGRATVLIGTFAGATSPARADTPLVGVDVVLDGTAELPLDPAFEHGLAVVAGGLRVDGTDVGVDELAYLGTGRDGVVVEAAAGTRVLLLGGEPFAEELLMWWNFVARTRAEVEEAVADWQAGSDRFGDVRTTLGRIDAPRPSWLG